MSTPTRKLSLNKLSLKRDNANPPIKLEERLHKVLAQAGMGSRRALEQRIADGLIKVNHAVATIGLSIKSGDRVETDGRTYVACALNEPSRVLLYHKPEGQITTREDPEGRDTVFDGLPALKGARWIAIGRLDMQTTGLLLLTTDGELANAMMHPANAMEREYVVRVRPPEGSSTVSDCIVDRLAQGVVLDDGPAKLQLIERIGGTDSHDWFRVIVTEGRNREVRRLWESQGCQVSRLKRTRYGQISLPRGLLRGKFTELGQEQVLALRAQLGLEEAHVSALTLQPVIGQRRSARATVHISRETTSSAYINGQSTADEGRELRRFDTFRDDQRGRHGWKKGRQSTESLTVSGESAAKQAQRPLRQRKPKAAKDASPKRHPARPFRSWSVPDTGAPSPRARPAKKSATPFNGQRTHSTASQYPYSQPNHHTPNFPSDHATPGYSPYEPPSNLTMERQKGDRQYRGPGARGPRGRPNNRNHRRGGPRAP